MNQASPRSLRGLLDLWTTAVEGTSRPQPPPYSGPDLNITSIVEHTDLVKSGACFVARVRTGTDGHNYIGKAIANGAKLILGQNDLADLNLDLGKAVYLQVRDTAIAEAWLSAAWNGFPSQHLVMIGVTGTDGKSTTVNLIYHILRSAGIKTGMLSTIMAAIGEDEEPLALHVTTPEAPVIQAYLRRMVEADITHCVLEATSHGLAQDRVGAINFDLAVVTNITHEHIDYHGDYEGYLAAKLKLFDALATGHPNASVSSSTEGINRPQANSLYSSSLAKSQSKRTKFSINFLPTAIFNLDDESYERLVKISVPRQITYSLKYAADVTATDLNYTPSRSEFTIHLPRSDARSCDRNSIFVSTKLVGEFNVYNILAATAACFSLGIDDNDIKRGLESIEVLTGRMQQIDQGQDFQVVVDFAHTPNALAKVIAAARDMTQGRIITVFGSAGKRDVKKRRLMAEISARDADLTILTAEDPRTESLDDILSMMAEGCRSQGGEEGYSFWRIRDRGRAIYFALGLANPDDLVLICGKGHEQSMCFGTTEYPWDDLKATRIALNAFTQEQPMPNLGLPTFNL